MNIKLKNVKNEKHKILMFNFVTLLYEKCCFRRQK